MSGAEQKPDKQKSTQYSFKEILQYCRNMSVDWPFIKKEIQGSHRENSVFCLFLLGVDVSQYVEHMVLDSRFLYEYQGLKFPPMSRIYDGEFSNAFMPNADLWNSLIERTDFSGAVLTSTNFCRADMAQNDFSHATLTFANLSYMNILKGQTTDPKGGQGFDLNFESADLSGASFERSFLYGSNFQSADLTETNFLGASLFNSNFSDTILDGKNFIDIRNGLSGVCFDNSSLTGFSFSHADLSQTSFKEAHIQDTDFSEAKSLQDANFSGAFLDNVTFHWETLKTAAWFGENSMKIRGHIRIFVDRDVEEVLEEAAQLGVRNLEGLRSLLIFYPRYPNEEGTDW